MVEVKNPCKKECPDRTSTCHGICEAYKEYYAYRRELDKLRAKTNASEAFMRKILRRKGR